MGKETTKASVKLIGQLEDAEIAALKVKHKEGVFFIKKDGRIAYFKTAGWNEINCFFAVAETAANVEIKWKELAGLLYVAGDRELIESPKYLPNVYTELQGKLGGEAAEVGNL